MRAILRNLYLNIAGSFLHPKPGVHIINSHFVKNSELDLFEDTAVFKKFIEFLTKKCELIKIEKAVEMISNDTLVDRPYIAFTFDDGFKECYSVVAPVLESYGCNAAFFINSNYIESTNEYKVGFNNRIKVHSKKPMNWNEIIELSNRGHIIGSHTLDHMNLRELSEKELANQMSLDKNKIESQLGIKCDYFAWPYGQKSHFSDMALKHAKTYFKFIFSGTDYKNYFSFDGYVINRRHVEPSWSFKHINYFLSIKKKR
ncbi:polysaccharide deacetylase family protein [Flavobacteriaceae bacterium]|nr:polysaccharide deacetylase family protein [Flavobacteriaceae bacterium]